MGEIKLKNGDVLNTASGIVWGIRKGRWRVVMFCLALAMVLLPAASWAKGPVVSGGGLWDSVLEFLRNLSH